MIPSQHSYPPCSVEVISASIPDDIEAEEILASPRPQGTRLGQVALSLLLHPPGGMTNSTSVLRPRLEPFAERRLRMLGAVVGASGGFPLPGCRDVASVIAAG